MRLGNVFRAMEHNGSSAYGGSPKLSIRLQRLLVWGALWWCVAAAQAAKFTAALDRDAVLLGESVKLTLSFEGASPGGMPRLPAIPGLQVGGGMSSSFNSTIGPDGKAQSVQSYSVDLIATAAGDFQIPALQIEIGGEKLSSAPLKLKVMLEDPVTPPAELATNLAFLWLSLPTREVFVGEVVLVEMRLYLRGEVGDISGLQVPPLNGDGYNAGKLVQGQQFQRKVGGATFSIIPLNSSLTPVKTGLLTIGPVEGTVVLHGGRRDFFGRYSQQAQARLSTPPRKLQVLPLPTQNVPADFGGAIGNFTLLVTAGPTNVATGDPITVRIQIAGRGAFDAVRLPGQTSWENFKLYPSSSNLETTDQLGLQGIKTFEQIISPESVAVKEIPPLSFSYFDPEAKQFRVLTHPPTPLVVRPGGATVVPTIAANSSKSNAQPPPAQDIVHIKPRPGTLAQISPPLITRPWFLALQAVPVFVWLGALGLRKRAESLARNPRLRRQRQVAQLIREGLPELRRHATANDSDAFFATLFRLLQEQLGERLDCPASAITEAVVDERLRPRGLPDNTQKELHELFQTCNLARYAPVKSGEQLAALVPRFEAVVRELQTLKV